MTKDRIGRTGVVLIEAERKRQIEAEGYTPEHDVHHSETLVLAAIAYLTGDRATWWPWSGEDWKPTPDDRVRELVKAGALIAAEIDRLTS